MRAAIAVPIAAALLSCANAFAATGGAIWVDTDAGCGISNFTDPDDCLAILALSRAPHVLIRGISTVFGNATVADTDETLRKIAAAWPQSPPRYSGAAFASDCKSNKAVAALETALSHERLTILALGPLTNIACLMDANPRAAMQIGEIVAVMGAEPGHLFHPAEGAPDAALFGHGPVFSDFNAAKDLAAAERVLGFGTKVTLTPYSAARKVEITLADLSAMKEEGPFGSLVAQSSVGWLASWNQYADRRGFYPFDLLAAAVMLEPVLLRCRIADVRVAADRKIGSFGYGPRRVLFGPLSWKERGPRAQARICDGVADPQGVVSLVTRQSPEKTP
jgi:pyrimidine-specific ribonucleoside hydrolase